MASLNLSSLSTFWGKVKVFIPLHFKRYYTRLFFASSETTVTLPESVYSYSRIVVSIRTNDAVNVEAEFDMTDFSGNYLPIYGNALSAGTTAPSYLKAFMVNISSDGRTLTLEHTNEFRIKNGSGCDIYNGSGCYIQTVYGYK